MGETGLVAAVMVCSRRIVGILAVTTGFVASVSRPAAARRMVVVLDPGHGGQNMGALGFYGVYEKFVTLEIAEKVAALLREDPQFTVFLTRSTDVYVGLRERSQMANVLNADAFISIHCNASPSPKPRGIETFYLGGNPSDEAARRTAERENQDDYQGLTFGEDPDVQSLLQILQHNGNVIESARLAANVQEQLSTNLPDTPNREVRQANFAVLRYSRVPAVVVEVGFLTNPAEGYDLLLDDYQRRLARAIATAVRRFLARQRGAIAHEDSTTH